jgi:uncharacterized membrane protein YdbT with pleckstrin-like domain
MFGREWFHCSDDERELVRTHPSRWVVFTKLFMGLFIFSNMVWLIRHEYTAGVYIGETSLRFILSLISPFSFFPVVMAQIRRLSVHYIVTDRNVWAKTRIYARDVDPTVLSRVQGVEYSQGFFDRLLGKGDVTIETAGTGGQDLVMREIPNPSHVTNLIRERVEEFDRNSGEQPL